MAVSVTGEFILPTGELPYLGSPKWWRDWILRGIHPKLPAPEMRIRTKKGFIRVCDDEGYRLEPVTKTITIKGKGASDDGGSESGSESNGYGRSEGNEADGVRPDRPEGDSAGEEGGGADSS